MKKYIEKILAILARRIIKKYQPKIIGVSGSLGKTSTVNALYAVLSYEYNVRQNIKNYNNELGLPLTVINAESGGKSLFQWVGVFLKAFKLLIITDKKYPEMLILEMGIDIKGDLDYLINIAQPDIGVLTSVSETHLEPTNPKAIGKPDLWLKNIEGVFKEKQKIITRLKEDGIAILNHDDQLVVSLRDKLNQKVFTYGFESESMVKAGEILFAGLEIDFCKSDANFDCKVWGINFKVSYNGSTVPVFLPHCFGNHHVYSALAAISAGISQGMNLVDIAEGLRKYRPAPGRMNIVAGIKYSLIIDDTYNSPAARAVITGLELLSQLKLDKVNKKIAVLGDMLELGQKSEEAHREVGLKITELEIDYLITVGNSMKLTASSAVEAGFSKENVKSFSDQEKAGRFLQDLIIKGDIIFVKGSQRMRMEKIVKEIMAEPDQAKNLLVRQSADWLKK